MICIGLVEERRGAFLTHHRGAGENGGQGTAPGEQIGRLDLELVGYGGERKRRAGADANAVDLDEGIARRGAEIDHDVSMIEQPGPGGVRRRDGHGFGDRCHRDHRHASILGSPRDLDWHGAAPADAEHDERIVGPKAVVGQDDLGEPLDPLDEHRLTLAVRSNDLGVEGHRQLGDGVKAGVGAVAGEHLLCGDAAVPAAKEMDEASSGDGVGTYGRGLGDGVHLGGLELIEETPRLVKPPAAHPALLVVCRQATFASRMRYLGLDLGGTNIKGAVVDVDPESAPTVLATGSTKTQAEGGPEAVAQRMIGHGSTMAEEHGPFAAVGVGVPGLFDFETGEVIFLTNFPGEWEGFPLRDVIAEGLGTEATLINDARAFTLAEATVGAGRGCSTVACFTLGTGIGGGLFIDGKLHLGAYGVAGELGHQTVEPDGPVCGCGNRGCLEAVARPPVIAAAAGRKTMEDVVDGAAEGDPASVAALEQATAYLGIGIANILTVVGPERIVIGGGAATAGSALLDPIRAAVKERVTLVPPDQVEIVQAELGYEAGAIGAALAAFEGPPDVPRFRGGEIPSARLRREEGD